MTCKTSDTYATQIRLCHAQRWLFRWAITRELEARAYGEEIEIMDGLDVMLPAARQVTLVGPTYPGGSALHIVCGLSWSRKTFRRGRAAQLLRWLSQGIARRPTSITLDKTGHFLCIELGLEVIDWREPDHEISALIDALVSHVTRVRAYMDELNTEPNLETDEAIRLRSRFQSELRFVPIAATRDTTL